MLILLSMESSVGDMEILPYFPNLLTLFYPEDEDMKS